MIETGDLQPSEAEMKDIIKLGVTDELKRKYYYRKASQKDLKRVIGLRDFHKKYVKDQILFRVLADKDASTHKTLLDVAVGRAADIHRWIRGGLSFVLGVDLAGENIRTADSGAYARYINIRSDSEGRNLPTMVFAIGNSADPLIDGSAGATPEESDILRAVFGRVNPAGPVPPYIEKYGAGRMRDGTDVIACMFALHYFFETRQAFEGLMKNIDDTLKMGGYFIGACFDGLKVRELLNGKKRDEKVIGVDGDTELWSIKKEYNDDDIDSNKEESMFGQALTVDFISIGAPHTEYLMHYNYLVRRLKEIGVEPLKEAEWKALGLNNSTELFSQTYDEAKKNNKNYVMSDAAKQFSFLNRWFIFKRNALAKPKEETAAVAETVAAVQGKPLAGQIVQIDADSAANDRYKLGVADAASWLSPIMHFPIPDEDEPATIYPSIEHYIMGMRFKLASSNPEYALTFTLTGEIHQKYNGIKQTEKAAGKLDDARLLQLLKEESAELKKNLTTSALKKLKITIKDADWIEVKDDVLKYALKARYTKDAKFKKAVDSAKAQGKYLLLYSASKTSDLGGRRLSDGTIEGDNKYGRFLMEIAGV
jgi:SAM-dependent methyltransferase